MNNLNETIELMNSPDYKERFKAEYYQLKIRTEKLDAMVEKYEKGKLDFTPSCPLWLLAGQLISMRVYLEHLEKRAEIEKVEL